MYSAFHTLCIRLSLWNMKKILKTTAVAWLIYRSIDILIHMIIFRSDYESMHSLYRADMIDMMWIFIIGSVFVIGSMTYLYSLLRETIKNKALILGSVLGIMIMIPAAFYTYASFPMPIDFTIRWFIAGFLQILITIKAIDWMYRK